MTQRRPENRTSVRNYRHVLEGRRPIDSLATRSGVAPDPSDAHTPPPFPAYFASTIYPVFHLLHTRGVTPDDRIAILCDVSTQ